MLIYQLECEQVVRFYSDWWHSSAQAHTQAVLEAHTEARAGSTRGPYRGTCRQYYIEAHTEARAGSTREAHTEARAGST